MSDTDPVWLMPLQVVVALACLAFAGVAWTRRRNAGEAIAFVGIALVTGAPVFDMEQWLGVVGVVLVVIGLVLWLTRRVRDRRIRAPRH